MAFAARVNETEIKTIPPKVFGSPLRQAAGRYRQPSEPDSQLRQERQEVAERKIPQKSKTAKPLEQEKNNKKANE